MPPPTAAVTTTVAMYSVPVTSAQDANTAIRSRLGLNRKVKIVRSAALRMFIAGSRGSDRLIVRRKLDGGFSPLQHGCHVHHRMAEHASQRVAGDQKGHRDDAVAHEHI